MSNSSIQLSVLKIERMEENDLRLSRVTGPD